MEYIFEACYSLDIIRRFVKDQSKMTKRAMSIINTVLRVFIAISFLTATGLYILETIVGYDASYYIPYIILLALFEIIYFILPGVSAKAYYKSFSKLGVHHIAIDHNGIVTEHSAGSEELKFEAITKLFKNRENTLYVLTSLNEYYIFPENCITQGDFGSFCYFMMVKTGLSITAI